MKKREEKKMETVRKRREKRGGKFIMSSACDVINDLGKILKRVPILGFWKS